MTVIKKVDDLKAQLGIESNFVIARGEAKEMNVSSYVALAGIHSAMLEMTSFAYKFDHPSSEQDIVSSMMGMLDQSQRILQTSQLLLGGAHERLAKMLSLRANKVIYDYSQLAGCDDKKRMKLIEKVIPKSLANIAKYRNTILAALQREKSIILEG